MRTLFSVSIAFVALCFSSSIRLSQSQQQHDGDGERIKSQSPDLHDFVASLNDVTFEHQTQASTGQTTGSWLVWFHDSSAANKQDVEFYGEMPSEENWLGDHVVLGSLDVHPNKITAERFQIETSTPFFLLFHKGQMYRYEKPGIYDWQEIRTFCRHPEQTHRGHAIPSPPSLVDDLLKQIQDDPTYAITLIGLLGASFVGIMFGRGKRTPGGGKKSN